MTPTVVLYGRNGCCLCDEARNLLVHLADRHHFVLHERDINEDERLLRDYLERIPVITIDGREEFELQVDEHQLEQALISASRAHTHQ